MAEFQEIAKHWKRMCKKYWSSTTCHGCPIAENEKAYEACASIDLDIQKMEECVMAWVAEYPEPVYPTWVEWLESQHILDDYHSNVACLNISALHPIPADIAQKLGLKPKEV